MILAGSIAFTRLLRLYESAVLRSLGATSRTLLSIATLEFLLEGMLAGAVGAAVASFAAWLTATKLLDVPWVFDSWTAFGIPVAAALLAAGVGAASCLDSVFVKPLGLLRADDGAHPLSTVPVDRTRSRGSRRSAAAARLLVREGPRSRGDRSHIQRHARPAAAKGRAIYERDRASGP